MRGVRWLMVGALGLMAGLAAPAQTPTKAGQGGGMPTVTPSKEPAPLVFYTGEGQFEIIAVEAKAAQEALILGNSVWRALAKPVGLPAGGFSTAVAVRLVPKAEWKEPAVFLVSAEAGGMVGVRICWDAKMDARIVRRALVQAVLLRQAVAWYGARQGLTVPLWLEQACASLSEVRDRPAMLDALQQESAQLAPPPLEDLLRWQRGAVDAVGLEPASFWLLLHLQAESEDAPRWGQWVRAILGGADPMQALTGIYGGAWKDPASRELWWQTGFYNVCRSSTLPLMSMEETRNWLADRCRWLGIKQGHEQGLSFDDLWAARKETWVKAEMTARAQQIQNQLSRLHPFYRNGAISMGRMYQAAVKGDEAGFQDAKQALSRDAADGRELETATTTALDALEAGR